MFRYSRGLARQTMIDPPSTPTANPTRTVLSNHHLRIDRSAPREQAEHAAIAVTADWIGIVLAKGVGPFDPGGIAGAAHS